MAEDEGLHVPETTWRRADEVGAFLPVRSVVRVQGIEVEIVKTYADCNVTALFLRTPFQEMVSAWPLEPPEILGPWSMSMVGDLDVVSYPPVSPERTSIVVSFDRGHSWGDEAGVTVPVDRGRTKRYDRLLSNPVPPARAQGLLVRLVGMKAGLVGATADLVVESVGEDILDVSLGRIPFRKRTPTGPGPDELWREWHPPMQTGIVDRGMASGNYAPVTASIVATTRVEARRLTPEELAELAPHREPPPAWRAWALPGREPLGRGEGSEGTPSRREFRHILRFDAPPPGAEAVEVSLEGLWAHRFAGGSRATVASPQRDRRVPLEGIVLEGAGCWVRLLQWEPVAEQGDIRLTARCEPPDTWPELRVVSEHASASLWCEPPSDGELSAVLPQSYIALFEGATVQIALRMVGRPVEPIALVAPITRMGQD